MSSLAVTSATWMLKRRPSRHAAGAPAVDSLRRSVRCSLHSRASSRRANSLPEESADLLAEHPRGARIRVAAADLEHGDPVFFERGGDQGCARRVIGDEMHDPVYPVIQ